MARGDYGVEAEASEVDFTDSLFAVEDDSEVDFADSVLAVLERSLTLSRATPFSVIPSSSAARLERSRLRPRTCGPRSLIRTFTDLPFAGLVTNTSRANRVNFGCGGQIVGIIRFAACGRAPGCLLSLVGRPDCFRRLRADPRRRRPAQVLEEARRRVRAPAAVVASRTKLRATSSSASAFRLNCVANF